MDAKELIDKVVEGKSPEDALKEGFGGKYGQGATELSRTKLTPRMVLQALLDLSDRVLHSMDSGDMSIFHKNRVTDDGAEELYMNVDDNVSDLVTMVGRMQRLMNRTGLAHLRW